MLILSNWFDQLVLPYSQRFATVLFTQCSQREAQPRCLVFLPVCFLPRYNWVHYSINIFFLFSTSSFLFLFPFLSFLLFIFYSLPFFFFPVWHLLLQHEDTSMKHVGSTLRLSTMRLMSPELPGNDGLPAPPAKIVCYLHSISPCSWDWQLHKTFPQKKRIM